MTIEVMADGLGFTEGPVLLPDGRVAVASISHGCVYLVGNSRDIERIDVGGGPNGLALGPDGALYLARNGGIWSATSTAEPGVQVIRNGRVDYVCTGMGAPNDLAFDAAGRLWVTDSVAEFAWDQPETASCGRLFVVDVVTGTSACVLDDGPRFLNGLAFNADCSELIVTATVESRLWAYPMAGAALGEPRIFADLDGHPDGMTLAADGTYWVALLGAHRLDQVDPTGRVIGTCALPDGSLPTNVCIDGDALLVTAAGSQSLVAVRF